VEDKEEEVQKLKFNLDPHGLHLRRLQTTAAVIIKRTTAVVVVVVVVTHPLLLQRHKWQL